MAVVPALQPFVDAPGSAAVLTDFDGTLAPIVDDPAAARPLDGVVEVLARLQERFAVAGVVSGRPVAYLLDHLGGGLWLSGLYGLERVEGGRRIEAAEAGAWRPVVDEAAARAGEALPVTVEHKGLSLTLHFRTMPDEEAGVRAWASAEATRTGLVVRQAKASVELHPPVEADKGTVVRAAAAGMAAVCFLGDDVGDLPAFDALDDLASGGVHTVRIAVRTTEAPSEMLARADLVVDGPGGALALLRSLLE
ncbi:MAG TPA: trehalose-phosphatase [Acidimicrobiales bacterium]|nr:trehalose-phosphatase [Acidimicrobiales bacterium]